MSYNLAIVIRRYARYLTIQVVTRVARLSILFSICMSMMLISLVLGFASIGGLSLVVLLMFLMTDVVRMSFWVYGLGRIYWNKFRPPYSDEDFVYTLPNNPIKYDYSPKYSAIRLPLGVLFFTMFGWALFQQVVLMNISWLIGLLEWVIDLFPRESLKYSYSVVSLFLGLPSWSNLPSRNNLKPLIETLLWIPSLYITLLLMWNLLYSIDSELAGDNVESGVHPKINSEFSPPVKETVQQLRRHMGAFLTGVLEGLEDCIAKLINWIAVPLILLYFVALGASQMGV